MQNLAIKIVTDKSPKQVLDAVMNVRGWWTENTEGSSDFLHDTFSVQFGDVHFSVQKVKELITNEKLVWEITQSRLNFLKNKEEWTGTVISFEIAEERGKTKLLFTHHGLVPDIECYNDCSGAWNFYIGQSLKNLIETGKGQPEKKTSAV